MKIKWILFFLFTLSIAKTYCGQSDLKISPSDNSPLIKALNSSNLIKENRENWISVRIYTLDNGSGSAGSDSGEVSHKLIIVVSEFDANPNQGVFEIGPFINWTELQEYEKEFEVEIEYGVYDKRESLKLGININELKIIK